MPFRWSEMPWIPRVGRFTRANLLAAERWHSPLDPETCRPRLKPLIRSFWAGDRPLVGRVHRRGFTVGLCRPWIRNGFQVVAMERWRSGPGERTLLTLRFGMHPLVHALLLVWTLGAGTAAVGLLWKANGPLSWPFIMAFPCAGYAIAALGRWFSRDDEAELRAILRGTLALSPD